MTREHFFDAGGYVDHGDASVLFPVDGLAATIHRHREAQLALEEVDGEEVVVIRPTGLASSYFLTQHPLTAIEISTLSDDLVGTVGDAAGIDLRAFTLVQAGRGRISSEDYSLTEYTT